MIIFIIIIFVITIIYIYTYIYYIILYYIILYCIILYYIILYCIILYYIIHVGYRGLNLAGTLPKLVPVTLVIAPKWSVARGNLRSSIWKDLNLDAYSYRKTLEIRMRQEIRNITRVWMAHSCVHLQYVMSYKYVQGDLCKQLQRISWDLPSKFHWPLESAHPDAPFHINHSPRNPPKTQAAWIWMISWTGEICQLLGLYQQLGAVACHGCQAVLWPWMIWRHIVAALSNQSVPRS